MYFQITAKVAEIDESRYTIQSTGEIVTKVQLSPVVPGMRDRVRCEMPQAQSPKPDLLERWELEESRVVVRSHSSRRSCSEPPAQAGGQRVQTVTE
jgi:hypothetical protein